MTVAARSNRVDEIATALERGLGAALDIKQDQRCGDDHECQSHWPLRGVTDVAHEGRPDGTIAFRLCGAADDLPRSGAVNDHYRFGMCCYFRICSRTDKLRPTVPSRDTIRSSYDATV